MPVEIKMAGNVACLIGTLDDRIDYSALLRLPSPMRLNLAGIERSEIHRGDWAVAEAVSLRRPSPGGTATLATTCGLPS